MAERSMFWTTSGVGDGTTLGDEELAEWLAALFTGGRITTEGVVGGVGAQLAVTPGSGLISVGSGVGFCQGYYYQNTASLNLSVLTPGNGTTGHRVVLRRDASSQTVRAALRSSADGTSAPPSVVQGTDIWEISLATLTVTPSGVITVTDARDYCLPGTLIYRRRGGHGSDWSRAGNTIYTPGGMHLQAGSQNLVFSSDDDSDSRTITFPQAFSDVPLIFPSIYQNAVAGAARVLPSIHSKTKSNFVVRGRRTAGGDWSVTIPVLWVAFGPR